MKATFREARIDVDGGVWLCLKVDEPAQARAFVLSKKNQIFDLEIKRHMEKRSLDANAMYWRLCGELAKETRQKPEEVYRRHIKDLGNYEVLCVQTKALEAFTRRWTSGHLGRFAETRESKIPGCTTVLAYYGSSDFDRREMSVLIDNCIQDCKALGIETASERELSILVQEWGT